MPGKRFLGFARNDRRLVIVVAEGLLGSVLLGLEGFAVGEAALEQYRCGRSIAPVKHVRI